MSREDTGYTFSMKIYTLRRKFMEIVKFNLEDKNELIELDKECFGENCWNNELWSEILEERQG